MYCPRCNSELLRLYKDPSKMACTNPRCSFTVSLKCNPCPQSCGTDKPESCKIIQEINSYKQHFNKGA